MNLTLFGLEFKDWAIVFATIVGPILAVQAQKAVERFRESRRRKTHLFEQLMATRASRVSPEHVRALNMIDLVFYGERLLGMSRRTAKEQHVLDSWKEYLDQLNNKADEGQLMLWVAKGDELFTNLLFAMSQDLNFKFGSYSPIAHGEIEAEERELRKATISLVTGKHALKMNVVSFPFDEAALQANRTVLQNLGKALESGVLHVEVVSNG
jgi:hypothetical protein